jgi:TIR domain
MPYVFTALNDVFVSYASVDDVPFPGSVLPDGWVTHLRKCIEATVPRRLGSRTELKVWQDNADLSGNGPLTRNILDAARDAAVLLLVMSTGYLRSQWCEDECNEFLSTMGRRRSSSVFIVKLDDIVGLELPVSLRDYKGYNFWRRDEHRRANPLGFPAFEPNEQSTTEFNSAVVTLGNEIADELLAQRRNGGAPVPSQRPVTGESLTSTVFLAQVTDDLDFKRAGVKSYLEQLGVRVLPTHDYSVEPNEFVRNACKDIESSQLFVQLLSDVPGKRPRGVPNGYAAMQLELAQERKLEILQWRPPGLLLSNVDEVAQRNLLEGPKVRAEGLEDFKREIRRVLTSPPREPVTDAFVFVNADSHDETLCEQVCRVVQAQGAEYATLNGGTDYEDLHHYLSSCDAMIVVYGESPASWVRSQLLEWRKSRARRTKPARGVAVLEGPPQKTDRLGIHLNQMVMLNASQAFDEKMIVDFLRLGGA